MPKRTILLTATSQGADGGFKAANKLATEGSHSKLEATATADHEGFVRLDLSSDFEPKLIKNAGKWFLVF